MIDTQYTDNVNLSLLL